MALTVAFNDLADEKLYAILHYRISFVSEVNARRFMSEVNQQLQRVANYPGSGRLSTSSMVGRPIRYVIVAKLYRLYYTFDDKDLLVIDLISSKTDHNPYE